MWSIEGHGREGGLHHEAEETFERVCLFPSEQGLDFPSYNCLYIDRDVSKVHVLSDPRDRGEAVVFPLLGP